jgi:hypothetical protein
MSVTITGGGGTSGGAAWTPATLGAALVFWFDWSTGLTKVSGNVSVWATGFGTSSSLNAGQAIVGIRPGTVVLTAGEVPLTTNGTFLNGASLTGLGLSGATLISRVRCDTLGGGSTEFATSDSVVLDTYANFGGNSYLGHLRSARLDSQPGIGTGWHTIFEECVGGNFKRWLDGTNDVSNTGTFAAGANWRFGAGQTGIWPGALGGFGLVNRALTSGERSSITSYLGQATG